ncbi:MAG: molybdenum cofactor cytidylyltransferase [Candidatus Latescibacterota bacterium]
MEYEKNKERTVGFGFLTCQCFVLSVSYRTMKNQIYGLVLAAGLSQRMGTAKQLLPFGTKTILQTVVDVLLTLDLLDVIVVLGHEAERVRNSLEGRGVTYCVNELYRDGMFSSVLCGVNAIPETADALLMALGDQPHIESRVGRAVVDAYQQGDAGIVIPTWDGKRGHPALVDLKRYRAKILSLSGDEGLKPVMRGFVDDTLELCVDDAGILRDLDTPEDYRAELERRKSGET